jgi:uncharacterized membrane protein
MTRTISGLFDNAMDVQNVVRELVNSGISRDNINVIASDAAGEYAEYHGTPIPADDTLEGVATGTLLGGLGGFVVGLAALAIPGVGPILAAGPIASALVGAGIGAVTGGLIGALVDLGLDEDEAEYYAEGVRRGSTLVTATVPDNMADRALSILNRYSPVNLDSRVSMWRESGWNRFDPKAKPFTTDEITRERARYGTRL